MLITFHNRKKSVETSNIFWLAKYISLVYKCGSSKLTELKSQEKSVPRLEFERVHVYT